VLGDADGELEGLDDGATVGVTVGSSLGLTNGAVLGLTFEGGVVNFVGREVGLNVGIVLGSVLRDVDGESVGDDDGTVVVVIGDFEYLEVVDVVG
jgi:hypothetical protein